MPTGSLQEDSLPGVMAGLSKPGCKQVLIPPAVRLQYMNSRKSCAEGASHTAMAEPKQQLSLPAPSLRRVFHF